MYPVIKRGLDILLSAIGLMVLSPLLLILMLVIRLDSPGKSIFRQKRVGRYGVPFELYKLRSMRREAPSDVATNQLFQAHMHITRVGRVLRKTSLDEIPQLVNVLRGQMSLIGPRPLVPGEGSIHRERLKSGAYDVRPGITGWAQVNGRDSVNAGKKAELDAYYAANISLLLDLRIVLMSVACVLTAQGIREGADVLPDAMHGDARAFDSDELKDTEAVQNAQPLPATTEAHEEISS